jgi:hypothetical protein
MKVRHYRLQDVIAKRLNLLRILDCLKCMYQCTAFSNGCFPIVIGTLSVFLLLHAQSECLQHHRQDAFLQPPKFPIALAKVVAYCHRIKMTIWRVEEEVGIEEGHVLPSPQTSFRWRALVAKLQTLYVHPVP